MLILQSNSEKIFNDTSLIKNTCNNDRETQVQEYNKLLLTYASQNGGPTAFPFRLVFMAPTECNQTNVCGDDGTLDSTYKYDTEDGTYRCKINSLNKCPSKTHCYKVGEQYYFKQYCGDSNCFNNSSNITYLVKESTP